MMHQDTDNQQDSENVLPHWATCQTIEKNARKKNPIVHKKNPQTLMQEF
jgi:hypothetical protein